LENQHLAGEVAAADSKVRAFAPALVDAVENRFRVQEVEFVVGLISCTLSDSDHHTADTGAH